MSRHAKFTMAIALIASFVATATVEAGWRRNCRPACQPVCSPQPVCCPAPVAVSSCCPQPTCVVSDPCVYAPKIDCSVGVDVYFNGNTICVKGKVGCSGKECKLENVCLGQGDVIVDCGDMQVKLRPSGSQVCIKARVKVFGNWTPWADLGCYP